MSLGSSNGAVLLGREVRLNLPPAHHRSLTALAKAYGWRNPSELAESLLAQAIEAAAGRFRYERFFAVLPALWSGGARV